MASYNPVVKNGASGAILYVSLAPRTPNGTWQTNPTLAVGDVKISLDGGALANLTTLPVVTPAASKLVKVTLSQAETNADNVTLLFSDAAGAEWCDLTVNQQTVAANFDTLSARIPAALVSGRMDSSVGAMAADVVTAAAIATDAIGSAELAASAVTKINTGIATAAAVAALPTAAQNATELLDQAAGVETGLTVRGALRLALAALAGKVSGAGTATEIFRNSVADTKARITSTVDASGNRTAITTDMT